MKQFIDPMRRDIKEALKQISEKYDVANLSLKGSVTYDQNHINFKIVAEKVGENGLPVIDDIVWKSLGFEENPIGKTFVDRGTEYKVVGINTGAPKNCLTIERTSDGKGYKCSKRFANL